jgi:hypothetical protein
MMNHEEYLAISSEIKELETLLGEIPEENAIERMGLEARLETARVAIDGVNDTQPGAKARLVFRGRPVFGTHGIAADFAAKAAGAFADTVTAVAAGIADNLRYMGPIPDRQKNQLLITGTAIGSFGFEFEVPQSGNGDLLPEPSGAETALQKVQQLFQLAMDGTDDDVAELVDEIHPRAVKKAVDFLDYIVGQGAWCGLEFKGQVFRFHSIDQLRSSVERLREDNIHETDEIFSGEFQGVLPASRTFEFKLLDQENIIRGKVGSDILNADILNREYLHEPVSIKLHVIQVGQGMPRYTLQSMDVVNQISDE